jgi:hypothetical protein
VHVIGSPRVGREDDFARRKQFARGHEAECEILGGDDGALAVVALADDVNRAPVCGRAGPPAASEVGARDRGALILRVGCHRALESMRTREELKFESNDINMFPLTRCPVPFVSRSNTKAVAASSILPVTGPMP